MRNSSPSKKNPTRNYERAVSRGNDECFLSAAYNGMPFGRSDFRHWFTILFSTLLSFISAAVVAGISYDKERNTVVVSGFASKTPATLKQVLKADDSGKWGVVSYDSEKDVYTITADLKIGLNNGKTTCFNIGSQKHPAESLCMKGDLYVYPMYVPKVNDRTEAPGFLARQKKAVPYNKLTLGVDGKEKINTRIIMCVGGKKGRRRFWSGVTADKKRGYGARLSIFNSEVVSEKATSRGRFDTQWYCTLKIVNSKISGASRSPTLCVRGTWAEITDSTLENTIAGVTDSSYPGIVKNCVIRNCAYGFGDWGGPMKMKLVGCRFENNYRNWCMSRGKVQCVDCVFGETKKENILKANPKFPLQPPKYPEILFSRRLVIAVRDKSGGGIANAVVMIIPEQVEPGFAPMKTTTGKSGETRKEIILNEYKLTASDEPDDPIRTDYSYEISVQVDGFKDKSVKGFKINANKRSLSVVLEKK